jgi:hypothetical protein
LLAATLTLQSGGLQLAVAVRVDLLLTPCQNVLRRDIADGTVQADVVVMLHVGDDSRLRFRVLLLGSLQDDFDISFSHGLTQIPMHEEATEPIQNAAQVIEGAAQVDIGNVDMPVLMWLQRLLETGSLGGRVCSSTGITTQPASTLAKYSPD